MAKAKGRVSIMYDVNGIHEKTLNLIGRLEDFGINPLTVERDKLMKYTMVILNCSRRNANRWVNFLYRLYLKDWF